MQPKWRPMTHIPVRRVAIVMRGASGYRHPNDVRYVSGYYDSSYRPLQPWLTHAGDSVTEDGALPSEWCYRYELEDDHAS